MGVDLSTKLSEEELEELLKEIKNKKKKITQILT